MCHLESRHIDLFSHTKIVRPCYSLHVRFVVYHWLGVNMTCHWIQIIACKIFSIILFVMQVDMIIVGKMLSMSPPSVPSPCCTSFPIVCPSVSKTIGFLEWTNVKHKELISKTCSRISTHQLGALQEMGHFPTHKYVSGQVCRERNFRHTTSCASKIPKHLLTLYERRRMLSIWHREMSQNFWRVC